MDLSGIKTQEQAQQLYNDYIESKGVENVMHSDLTKWDRFVVKNFGNSNTDESLKYLRKKYPKHMFTIGKDEAFLMRAKGEQSWKKLDPSGFKMDDMINDALDMTADVGAGLLEGGATALGALGGGLPGAIAAGGASSAGLEALRQAIGTGLGANEGVEGSDVAWAGGLGAAGAGLLGAGVGKTMLGKRGVLGSGYNALTRKGGPIATRVLSGGGDKATVEMIGNAVSDPGAIKALQKDMMGATGVLKDDIDDVLATTIDYAEDFKDQLIERSGIKSVETAKFITPIKEALEEMDVILRQTPSDQIALEGRKEVSDFAMKILGEDVPYTVRVKKALEKPKYTMDEATKEFTMQDFEWVDEVRKRKEIRSDITLEKYAQLKKTFRDLADQYKRVSSGQTSDSKAAITMGKKLYGRMIRGLGSTIEEVDAAAISKVGGKDGIQIKSFYDSANQNTIDAYKFKEYFSRKMEDGSGSQLLGDPKVLKQITDLSLREDKITNDMMRIFEEMAVAGKGSLKSRMEDLGAANTLPYLDPEAGFIKKTLRNYMMAPIGGTVGFGLGTVIGEGGMAAGRTGFIGGGLGAGLALGNTRRMIKIMRKGLMAEKAVMKPLKAISSKVPFGKPSIYQTLINASKNRNE